MKNGITLIALIITIIVLVILAAVSISAVYNSNIINYAVNGAINYTSEATRENEILDQTASIMQSAVDKISDIAGGSTGEKPGGDEEEEPEEPIDEPGIDFGKLTEEIDGMIGQYVDYTPVSGTFSDHVGETYSGDAGNNNTKLSTITSLKWRILDATSDTLTLISDMAANTGFGLYGYNGYNNAVLLLNNACKAMYSNNDLWTIGRHLNIDDIENYSNISGAPMVEYSVNEYTYYPNIFEYEINGAPNGTYGTLYGSSNQDEYITGSSGGGYSLSFKGKLTHYAFTMSTSTMQNQTYVDLFSSSIQSWLASRCVDYNNFWLTFNIFNITNNNVTSYWLCDSNGDTYNPGYNLSYAIRPVVEIDLSKVNVGLTGDGGADTPYSIEAK